MHRSYLPEFFKSQSETLQESEQNCIEEMGHEENFPEAHTCVNVIKFPGYAYQGDNDIFMKKMKRVFELTGALSFSQA